MFLPMLYRLPNVAKPPAPPPPPRTEYMVLFPWTTTAECEESLNNLAGGGWAPHLSMTNGWLIMSRRV
jgi:hypothetical protein